MIQAIAATTIIDTAEGKSTSTLATVFKSRGMSQLRAPVHFVTVKMTSAGVVFEPECNMRAKHWHQTAAKTVPVDRMCKNCLEVRAKRTA